METIVARANQLIGKMRQHFMVDDLKFLRKGGPAVRRRGLCRHTAADPPHPAGDPEGKIVVLAQQGARP